MINNAPTINQKKLSIFLRNVKKHIDHYSTLSEEQKNNSLKKAIIESYSQEESNSQYGYYNRRKSIIPLNEESFQLLPKDLLKNKIVAKKIIENNPIIYKHLEENLKLNGELIKCLFETINYKNEKTTNLILDEIDFYFPGFLTNKEICLKVCKVAIHSNLFHSIFSMIPISIKKDKKFIKHLLKENYTFYRDIPLELKEDFNIMIYSMKISNGKVFGYFHTELRSDLFFSYYMAKFGEINPNDLSGELRKKYISTNSSSTNSFLNSLILNEKLDNQLTYKSTSKEKTNKI